MDNVLDILYICTSFYSADQNYTFKKFKAVSLNNPLLFYILTSVWVLRIPNVVKIVIFSIFNDKKL